MGKKVNETEVKLASIGFIAPIPIIVLFIVFMGPVMFVLSPVLYFPSAALCIVFLVIFHLLFKRIPVLKTYVVLLGLITAGIVGYIFNILIFNSYTLSSRVDLEYIILGLACGLTSAVLYSWGPFSIKIR